MNTKWMNPHYRITGIILITLLAMPLYDRSLETGIIGALISIAVGIASELVGRPFRWIGYLAFSLNTVYFPEFFPAAFLIMPVQFASLPALIFVANQYRAPAGAATGFLLAAVAFLIQNLDRNYRDSNADYLNENDAHREFEKRLKLLRESRTRDIERSSRESVLEERNRIARSLHDYIGHTVSSAIMQLEAFKLVHLAEHTKTTGYGAHDVKDEDGKQIETVETVEGRGAKGISPEERIDIVIHTLKSGMVDIRTSIHHLFDASLEIGTELDKLKEKYPAFAFSISSCNADDIAYNVKRELLQIIGELVSNASRHSDANQIKIALNQVGEYYTLLVKDNGSVKIDRVDPGLGMTGIKTFADKHGGDVDYSYSKGFQVHLRFKAYPEKEEV